ncbi:MAG TPA: hypothetical protein VF169_20240 [Albitalea sp.]|uniref:hypothetical protein n=1 Tax=Piscinibacter sp. TaxID=1903157 RepID=UPI002ED2B5F1
MKHAGPRTLAELEPLLRMIRRHASLVERTPGSFYRRSKGWLHFHEDPAGIFADIKLDGISFARLRATTPQEQAELIALVDRQLAQASVKD